MIKDNKIIIPQGLYIDHIKIEFWDDEDPEYEYDFVDTDNIWKQDFSIIITLDNLNYQEYI